MNRREPSYIELYRSGELRRRFLILNGILKECRLCPRNCGCDRTIGQTGYCRSGGKAVIASVCRHRGEEPALSGSHGIGNIFFANCNLHCVYCQNHQISHASEASFAESGVADLSRILMNLQEQECGRIGLVSPVQFIPMIVGSLLAAIPEGFRLPLVYNTNGYDNPEILRLLEGVIDIYLPDLKYSDNQNAVRFSDAPAYAYHSRRAVREMYRQLGSILHNETDGTISRGLIIRHLVLPGQTPGSEDTLRWIAENLSPRITVSVMSQYYPAYRAADYPEINRPVSKSEYDRVIRLLEELGFDNGWIQEPESRDHYRPDFSHQTHPFESPAEPFAK